MAQWFGPKVIGYGVGPRSWQGWLATAIFLAVAIGSRFIRFEAYGLPHWTKMAILTGAVAIYIALTIFTYEPD